MILDYVKDYQTLNQIKKQNQKIETHQLTMSPLQKIYTKSNLHKSDLIQYFC